MTDTPETDHLESGLGTAAQMIHPTLWQFARTLERERDDAIAESINAVNHIIRVALERNAVTEQRDRLAEALRMITTFDYTYLQCDNGHGARSVATEALQSLGIHAFQKPVVSSR